MFIIAAINIIIYIMVVNEPVNYNRMLHNKMNV